MGKRTNSSITIGYKYIFRDILHNNQIWKLVNWLYIVHGRKVVV